MMTRKTIGQTIAPLNLANIEDTPVDIPASGLLTHLQFRRFAGCPICNLHLQSFFKRSDELKQHAIREVIVFHATQEKMHESVIDVPFDLIADPERIIYKQFGVEGSWRAVLNLGIVKSGFKGMKKFGVALPQNLEAELGLPADFLIDEEGKIVALKYGDHADDQWSVDEVLDLSKQFVGDAA